MVFFVLFQLTLAVGFVLMNIPDMRGMYVPVSTASMVFLFLATYSASRALRDDGSAREGRGGSK
jgi:hypothetical protein